MAKSQWAKGGEHKPQEIRMVARLKAFEAIMEHRSTTELRRHDGKQAAIAELRKMLEEAPSNIARIDQLADTAETAIEDLFDRVTRRLGV